MPNRSHQLAAAWVFAILLVSYAYFWQSRDWNSASRLMLTYALGDRGTIQLDGLARQTGDRSYFRGHSYSDKGPGYSLLALPPYLVVKQVFSLPDHPRDRPGFAHWPADYWVTLATSGLLTAFAGLLLTLLAGRFGCGPRRSALVGLAYGLATPAYVYATLAYGHQASASFLLVAFALLWDDGRSRRPRLRAFVAGGLASYAAIIELSVGPVSAILGWFLLAKSWRGEWPSATVAAFTLGALGPALILLSYNTLAFDSPLNLGYAYHVIPRFREIHGRGNPLGLNPPDGSLATPLLFGRYRGLLFYAPIVALAPLGWLAMARARRWSVLLVSFATCAVLFLINLSYPEWTGGWSTGPRLLVTLLPFALLAVAAALGAFGRWVTVLALVLALAGGVVVGMFQGVGGRIPEMLPGRDLSDPFFQVVWPLWRGDPVPDWRLSGDGRFGRNLLTTLRPALAADLATRPGWAWLSLAPLFALQAVGLAGMLWSLRPRPPVAADRR